MPNISLYFVRHGQRIDQVDPSWTNTSPCPQDPPLTALGKLQARQTGKMIKDFAYESVASSSTSTSASPPSWTLQRITPPLSPDRSNPQSSSSQQDCYDTSATAAPSTLPPTSTSAPHDTTIVAEDGSHPPQQRRRSSAGSSSARGNKHHFAIITSPFLRCSETAIELAKGMRTGSASATLAQAGQSTVSGPVVSDTAAMDKDHDKKERDVVTIAVEAGLAGK